MLETVTISRLSMRPINMGLIDEEYQNIIDLLNESLVITYSYLLLIKTRRYYWEMVGQNLQFMCLYRSWKEHCQTLTVEIDQTEEQVITLGGNPYGIIEGIERISRIALVEGKTDKNPITITIISGLLKDHEAILCKLHECCNFHNNQAHNDKVAQFLEQLIRQHQNIATMLHCFLDEYSIISNRLQPSVSEKLR